MPTTTEKMQLILCDRGQPEWDDEVNGNFQKIDNHTHDGVSAGARLNHSLLWNLEADDHTQYLTAERHNAADHRGLQLLQSGGSTLLPSPSIDGRVFFDTDLQILRLDDTQRWRAIGTARHDLAVFFGPLSLGIGDQRVVFMAPVSAYVNKAWVVPKTAISGSSSDYFSLTLKRYMLGVSDTICSRDYNSGGFDALVPHEIGTPHISARELVPNSLLLISKTEVGNGLDMPELLLLLELVYR